MLHLFIPLLCGMENLFIQKKGLGVAYKPHMKDFNIEAFVNQSFNQDGFESAVLQIK